ncbi:hypothetical protein D8S78_24630 [Natrialba swarupiae]|nr:hypothetical protein [Natrialba swarupiae]
MSHMNLRRYMKEGQVGNFREYLERVQHQAERGQLGEDFFDSLDSWTNELQSLEFQDWCNEREQTEGVIKFINKFIFIQTLDDHF